MEHLLAALGFSRYQSGGRRLVHGCPWLIQVALAALSLLHISNAVTFNISINLPYLTTGKRDLNMILFMQANANATLHGIDPTGQHNFQLFPYSTNGTQRNATLAMQDAIERHNIVGMIGDRSSSLTIPQVLIGGRTTTWVCSGGSTSMQLSDKSLYPYFFRTTPQDSLQGLILARFVSKMGWNTVSLLFSADAYGTGVAESFVAMTESLNVRIVVKHVIQVGQTDVSLAFSAIEEAGSRIIVLCVLVDGSVPILRQARARGLIGKDYVWLGPATFSGFPTLNSVSASDLSNLDGFLHVDLRENSYNAKYNASVQRFKDAYPDEPIPSYSFMYLDCLTALATGILRIVNDTSAAAVLERRYYPDLKKYFLPAFEGVSGRVVFDDNGNRLAPYQVMNFYNGTPTVVFDILPDNSMQEVSPIRFFSGTSTVPLDMPLKDLLVATWSEPAGATVGALNVASLVLALIVWGYLWKHRLDPTVKSLSFPFLSLVAIGCMFVLASSIASVGIPSPAICQVRLWLFTLGIALVLSSSAVKAFRLWVIFSIKSVSLGKRLGNQRMLALVGALMLGQLIILAAWDAAGPKIPIRISTKTYVKVTCGSGDNAISIAFFAITAVYNGLLLCAVILFAYRTRNVSSGYRESSWSLYSAQCIAVFSVVVGAFSLLDFGSLTIMAFVVKHVATWFTTMFVFSVLVGRVALAVYISANVPAASNTRRSGYISTEILSAGEVLAGRVIVPHGPWLGDGAAAGGGAGHEKPSSGHGGSKTDATLLRSVCLVAKTGSLRVKWTLCEVWMSLDDGIVGVLPAESNDSNGSDGQAVRINCCYYNPDPPARTNCLELTTKGASFTIQFHSESERRAWIRALKQTSALERNSGTAAAGTGAMNASGSISTVSIPVHPTPQVPPGSAA